MITWSEKHWLSKKKTAQKLSRRTLLTASHCILLTEYIFKELVLSPGTRCFFCVIEDNL